jgi:hypothetical protein
LLLTSGRPTKPYSWGRIDLLLTSGRPTKPYSWGRIDLLLTSGRPTKPYSWGRIDLLLTSGRPTKPYSWGRIDLLLKRILVFVDSWMVQRPKLYRHNQYRLLYKQLLPHPTWSLILLTLILVVVPSTSQQRLEYV